MHASWQPEGEEMSVDQIRDEIRKHPAAHCVLTGGEPMIAMGIQHLAAALGQADAESPAFLGEDNLARSGAYWSD
jgi:organic radical activating enzyme